MTDSSLLEHPLILTPLPDEETYNHTLDESYEWLQTNSLGGFACGTVLGPNTRRYHGLLVAALDPPVDRRVLVNQVSETVHLNGQDVPLASSFYPDVVHPRGYEHMESFELIPHPRWTYKLNGTRIQKEIAMVPGENTTILRWSHEQGAAEAILRVRPMLSGRNYHVLQRANSSINLETRLTDGAWSWKPHDQSIRFYGTSNGHFRADPDWYHNVRYPIEQSRGLDFEEDWWTPGWFEFDLSDEPFAWLRFSTGGPTGETPSVRNLFSDRSEGSQIRGTSLPERTSLERRLTRAARDFRVSRNGGSSLLAGYPWFTDWGRDTFISLPGLLLVTGECDRARTVLTTYARFVDRGMIPNRFPDQGDSPEYNTIDASLWFVHAVGKYLEYTDDPAFAEETGWPAVKRILEGYDRGTRFDIRRSGDGLIRGGDPGTQLTWMDARVDGHCMTPRDGKPVEIQALWIRALEVGQLLARDHGNPQQAELWSQWREQGVDSFRDRFWYDEGGYLYDVVDGHAGDDTNLRPNQLFALTLCEDLVPEPWAESVVDRIENHLLTPVGLRTLSPEDPDYRGTYQGDRWARDGAYHQGTVWPYLLGPFVSAWMRVHGDEDQAASGALDFFSGLEDHLEEACLGQVSEIFDGDEPHHPRGCFAQAWSVAEPLRALRETL